MARVLVLSADLMFGSRLLAALSGCGHEPELIADESRLRERIADSGAPQAELLIADLTDDRFDGATILESLGRDGLTDSLATLAFYSHVDAAVRERAVGAGFDLVVPRSRIAREAGGVVAGLLQARAGS